LNKKDVMVVVLVILVAVLVVFSSYVYVNLQPDTEPTPRITNRQQSSQTVQQNVLLSSSDFTTNVNNKYFVLIPGTKFTYRGKTDEGAEENEVYVTKDTKVVAGINTIVVWDRVWLDGEIKESTYDWFAQDKFGNVWYFGEDSKDYEDGKVKSTKGSWKAGVNGAKPGIVMKANPKAGDKYQQEYLKGVAEDMAEVIRLGAKLNIGSKNYTNCIEIKEWNPLEKDSDEYKYFCQEVRNLVYEFSLEDKEQLQLVSIAKNSEPR